jgi:hypothetical protein
MDSMGSEAMGWDMVVVLKGLGWLDVVLMKLWWYGDSTVYVSGGGEKALFSKEVLEAKGHCMQA